MKIKFNFVVYKTFSTPNFTPLIQLEKLEGVKKNPQKWL